MSMLLEPDFRPSLASPTVESVVRRRIVVPLSICDVRARAERLLSAIAERHASTEHGRMEIARPLARHTMPGTKPTLTRTDRNTVRRGTASAQAAKKIRRRALARHARQATQTTQDAITNNHTQQQLNDKHNCNALSSLSPKVNCAFWLFGVNVFCRVCMRYQFALVSQGQSTSHILGH